MPARTTALGVSVGLLLAAGLSASSVHLGVSPSGRKVIVNESSVQLSRRLAPHLLPVPREARVDLTPLIARHSDSQRLDPRLVRAVIQVESGYNVRARSNKGAMGLMQLMPATAVELAVADPYDPDQNLRGGTTYLRQMIDHFGRLDMAVAAYNAGPGAVERYRGIPPYADTVDYVRQVLALYHEVGGVTGAVIGRLAGSEVASQYRPGFRARPYAFRNREGRLVLTTSLSGASR
jgi:hypothetical protein